jgi:hypothetical protein
MVVRTGDKIPTQAQDTVLAAVVRGLEEIGYLGPLLQRNYGFADWFQRQAERNAVAAAFAETPVSYDSACIGVVRSDEFLKKASLVDGYRALGAPIILEIDDAWIREWEVSRISHQHQLIASYHADDLPTAIAKRATEWRPQAVLRSKNIGASGRGRQLGLFAGLLPELEGHIQAQLEPLLIETLAATKQSYFESTGRKPEPGQLFKLVFWILTAKVFHDREVPGFTALSPDPDVLLEAVAKHYSVAPPKLLNLIARQTASLLAWDQLDFRNLSVEVLSQIWSSALVDANTRARLGIHRTSRSLVRYIIDRMPFEPSGDDERIVFEPCSGSAAFLIGAMQSLRHRMFGASAKQRHEYFVRHLIGMEFDAFGSEISKLALTLADFPNPDGWNILSNDVFEDGAMTASLRRSAMVLCNPPFEEFEHSEKRRYDPQFGLKPAELLRRILLDLHPAGVLGFVLPRNIVDGRRYKPVREALARRFASLEFTVLPDRAFQEADVESALMIATEPIPHDVCRVSYRRVEDNADAWRRFELDHVVGVDNSANFGTEAAREGFTIPDLPEVWEYLRDYPTLDSIAEIHRGLEWTERFNKGVRSSPAPGFHKGVAPHTSFSVFEVPHMEYLSVRPADQRRNSYKCDWSRCKAIFNKTTRSRGRWRLAAFPDRDGVTCAQTYNAAWPTTSDVDEVIIAAILNGPVANAFVSTREGKTDITMETLRRIPVPVLTHSQKDVLRQLVTEYQERSKEFPLSRATDEEPTLEQLLKQIDATVLDGYRLPARLEREVLDFFNGHERPVSHPFGDYVAAETAVAFSLSQLLDPIFLSANAGALLRTIRGSD